MTTTTQTKIALAQPIRIRQRATVLRRRAVRTFVYGTVIVLSTIFTLPFLWMVLSSFKTQKQVISSFDVWPNPWVTVGYTSGWTALPVGSFLTNSLIYSGSALATTVIASSLTAFAFSRLRWKGRDLFFVLALATMMVPPQVLLLPQFIFFTRVLNWANTLLPLIIPLALGHPFYIFLLRQFFMTLPMELDEAARIDGATSFGIYWRIILPLAKPALATVGLFAFIFTWNDFFGPLIYLQTLDRMTFAVGLQLFRGQFTTDFPALMAMSTLSLVPIITIFFFTQKTYIKGIALTGIKG